MAETLTLTLTLTPMAESLRRRRKWLLILAGAGISGYGVYKLYHLPQVSRKRTKLYHLLNTLFHIADAVSSSAESISILSSDLNAFLRSDFDEIPASVKQLSKIACSDEFLASVSRVSEALTSGMVRGIGSGSGDSPSFSDQVLERVFSPSGTGFASIVVGSFARNLAIGFMHQDSDSPATPAWMDVIGNDQCKELVANCIEKFVGTLVGVYLEKTAGINTYDELFAGITNPQHDAKVKDFMLSVSNGAVETLVRTCHHVIYNSNPTQEEDGGNCSGVGSKDESGWSDKVSSTLAVPSNRRLILDMTGRVTFETVRSFLDFALRKFVDCARSGARAVTDGVVERGMEVVGYVSAKSMLVITICLALCMRVMAGTRVLMPA